MLVLAIGLVTANQVLRFTGALEQDDKEKSYKDIAYQENADTAVDDILERYHDTMNEFFNLRTKKLVELNGSNDKEDLAKLLKFLTPPEYNIDSVTKQPTSRKPCSGEGENINLSTYCLSQIAINEYFDFRAGMLAAREKARSGVATRFEQTTGKKANEAPKIYFEQRSLFDVEKNLQDYASLLERIDREIDLARQTLDQSLATYHEFQLALPLHTKYMQVIESLEIYRDKIADIRKQVEQYPPTFLDVTTTSCT